MLQTNHARNIEVVQNIQSVKCYLQEVKNLPKWTTFFSDVIERKGNRYVMNTKIGKAQTWIEAEEKEEQVELFICSIFPDKTEKATIFLKPNGNRTNITFNLTVPPTITEERLNAMLKNLETEMSVLKLCLER
jgi:hypothetical protein